ncbi:MAG TPA: hypothetical protein VJL27_03245 [Patescibacteria group bacterium]|nr:hypothetical protein [Patescibacteria group bacterium]
MEGSLDGVYPELAEGLGMTADGQIVRQTSARPVEMGRTHDPSGVGARNDKGK